MTKVQKLDLLLAIYIAAIVAAELMGGKIFTINNLVNASVGIFAIPLTFSINDIVAEVYGKEKARSFIKTGLIILIGLSLYIVLALVLPPAKRFLINESAYQLIFAKSLRITLASLTAFFISERLDVYIFSKIRERLGHKQLWFRNNASNFLSMFFDTTIFMILAFYTPGNFWFIVSLIWPYWLLKCSYSALHTPLTYLGVRWLKK